MWAVCPAGAGFRFLLLGSDMFLEESHSGLVGATGNRVCDEHRGFESHLLRSGGLYKPVN